MGIVGIVDLGWTSGGLFAGWQYVIDVQIEDRVGDLGRSECRPDDLARAGVHLSDAIQANLTAASDSQGGRKVPLSRQAAEVVELFGAEPGHERLSSGVGAVELA